MRVSVNVLVRQPRCLVRSVGSPASFPLATIHQDLLMLNPPISSHLASAAVDLESFVLAKGETPSVAHFEEADFELVSPLVWNAGLEDQGAV